MTNTELNIERIAELLYYGAILLPSASWGPMDSAPDGACIYSRAMQSRAPSRVLALFQAYPRVQEVITVFDAMCLRDLARDLPGGESALDRAIELLGNEDEGDWGAVLDRALASWLLGNGGLS